MSRPVQHWVYCPLAEGVQRKSQHDQAGNEQLSDKAFGVTRIVVSRTDG